MSIQIGLDSVHAIPRHAVDDLSQVVVIIPALNEETSLPFVLRDLPVVGEVIVVDNRSTDRTALLARSMGATVVYESRGGYGAACWRGLTALEERGGWSAPAARVVVFLDADYSDHPELLPQLVRPILAGNVDFVLGSRLMGKREPGAMPAQSIFGNRLACLLMRLFFGAQYTDLGPFRAIRYDSLRQLKMVDRGFGWTVEMQIRAHQVGLRTIEIPVPYRRRIGVSKISGTIMGSIKAGMKILYLIAHFRFFSRSR